VEVRFRFWRKHQQRRITSSTNDISFGLTKFILYSSSKKQSRVSSDRIQHGLAVGNLDQWTPLTFSLPAERGPCVDRSYP
jgi:hypothetical protein